MNTYQRFIHLIGMRLKRLSIYHRILIGNSLIIMVGAIGGTLLTNYLAEKTSDLYLIVLFASIGIMMSILTNSLIIKNALQPIYQLQRIVSRIDHTQTKHTIQEITDTYPDIQKLSSAIYNLLDTLEKRTQQLAALSRRFINLQEEERHRIALELHDQTGQSLSLLSILLERLQSQIPDNQPKIEQELIQAQNLTRETLQDLRNTIYGLRPTLLDDLGLVPAIRWYARNCLERQGIKTSVSANNDAEILRPQVKTNLFRIVQETIHNIQRHANAQQVSIKLEHLDSSLHLEIHDDGKGFDPKLTSNQAVAEKKLGLIGIQERVELIGGSVNISSNPGAGTTIHVWVPTPTNEAQL